MIASPDLPAWDYVVIGAGSAGCALAGRLSENPANRVLLVEAGGWDFSPYIHIPAAIIKAVGNPKLDWCYLAEPDPTRGGKIDLWPAGRVMGGGSSINGMLYVRGAAHDFDAWAAQGCDGWSAADVLPVFKRMETFTGGNSRVRGQDGPLHVSYLRSRHPLADVFIDAAQERGLARNPDYNGSDQEGVSLPQVTQKTGRRFSAAQAYIWPVRNRPNLEIWTNAQCLRLAFDGKRCTGARVRRGGAEIEVQARREVIVSAGAIASPKLLMLSGIGPAADLARHGIAPVADLKGVGANLREHAEGMVSVDVRERTYNVEINSPRIALHLLNWLLFRRGPATSPYPHAVAFFRSTPDKPKPDTQAMLGPYAFSFSEAGIVPYLKPAVSAAVNISYPRGTGRIGLRSADPDAPPVIEHGLLASADDVADLTSACRYVRGIFQTEAFKPHVVRERLPGPDVERDDEWADYFRRTCFLGYHPVGTCRMGRDDSAVVSPDLKVRGVEGLRVADASIMPGLVSGNTNACAIMIGERAADLIRADN